MRIQSLLYAAINPPMQALLRSRFHGIASKHLCLLSFRGRKSGRSFTTPLSFTRDGNTIRLLTSRETQWWKNFAGDPAGVTVEIGREVFEGRAQSFIQDSEHFREGIRRFLTALPRDAIVYGIKLDRERRPREADIASAAGHVVLVEIEVRAAAPA